MSLPRAAVASTGPAHPWLRSTHVSFVAGRSTPLLEYCLQGLSRHFAGLGHTVQPAPNERTDVIITTALGAEPLPWRQALLFSARKRYGLEHSPTLYTLVHITPGRFAELLEHFRRALAKDPADPADYAFPGLAPRAHRVLAEQAGRGGPILAVERLAQAQAKSIRIVLLVGEERPQVAYHFDLAGAHPRTVFGSDEEGFFRDIVLRIVTALSTGEVVEHQVLDAPVPEALWQRLETPPAMTVAGQRLGQRRFFTEMVRIADLVAIPVVADVVASQYSEGCFGTWDATLGALIATVTGSASPIDKDKITEKDLAIIAGVRADGRGALVRHVAGKENLPPSSEAVEMAEMDQALPWIALDAAWGAPARVPVVRSKLHGHRGIAAYDPALVEYVPLDEPYFHYPVSCATSAQAQGIRAAFGRSVALCDPADPRQLVFTILPCHGVVIAEKWVPGKAPLQAIWEAIDAGALQVDNRVPQGPLAFLPGAVGRYTLTDLTDPDGVSDPSRA